MADLLTIMLFFAYTLGFGFTVTSFVKLPKNKFDRIIVLLGTGLATFISFGAVINFFRIPIDWRIFFVASMAYPIYYFVKNKPKIDVKVRLTRSNIASAVALMIFIFTFYMYASGAFAYPYFEDDDPWTHAISVKYIAVEKDLFAPKGVYINNFLDPYPPGYGLVLGVLHQTSGSLMWTMKFFNALIISLGILFFYIFMKQFSGDYKIALASAFMLAAMPAYLSHFIWAHALVATLFFPAFYAIDRIRNDKRWAYIAAICISALFFTHPSQSIKLALMVGIYWAVRSVCKKKIDWKIISSGVGAGVLALVWWIPVILKRKGLTGMAAEQLSGTGGKTFMDGVRMFFNPEGGSATKAYIFKDFFFVTKHNMINNPIGIGWMISILAIVGILVVVYMLIWKHKHIVKSENRWMAVALFWFVFTFLGVNSATFNLPVGLFAFRFWMLLAIPTAILGAVGLRYIASTLRSLKVSKQAVYVVCGVILVLVLLSSGIPKFNFNRAMWPPGVGWTSGEELQGFISLKKLPANTRVFTLTSGPYVLGFDKFFCQWCSKDKELQDSAYNMNTIKFASSLKERGYEYIVISTRDSQHFGMNETNNFIKKLSDSGMFKAVSGNGAFVIFRVV